MRAGVFCVKQYVIALGTAFGRRCGLCRCLTFCAPRWHLRGMLHPTYAIRCNLFRQAQWTSSGWILRGQYDFRAREYNLPLG